MQKNVVVSLLAGAIMASASLGFAEPTPRHILSKKPLIVFGDTTKKAPKNWFNLDPAVDKVQGVSTEKTYKELLKGKKSQAIVVAVIDSGVDIDHEDLQGKVWKNEKEIPNNGIDDDGNGYVDDVSGWNFIGGKDGKNINQDTYEVTRVYKMLKAKYEGKTEADATDKAEFKMFQKAKKIYEAKSQEFVGQKLMVENFYNTYKNSAKLIQAYLDKETPTETEVEGIETEDKVVLAAKNMVLRVISNGSEAGIKGYLDYLKDGLEYGYNLDFDPRKIVGDNYEDKNEKGYGNPDVKGADPKHGTHVAGIIAANRNNDLGMKGIAENVRIMAVRAVPNGDERDKDIANAIRYAVDNGAKIINMSFGKSFSPEKKSVDDAVRYAESKGVLLVHAAGNDGKNIDTEDNFPNRTFLDNKEPSNWLEVGALSWKSGDESVANFSNYGKKSVDLFAPGVDIYSTTPNQKYEDQSGTSMAAPVASGVAALLLSYYPHLTAAQVREILIKSTVKPQVEVYKPAEEPSEKVKFADLSITGGIINAYEAIRLADKIKIPKK